MSGISKKTDEIPYILEFEMFIKGCKLDFDVNGHLRINVFGHEN
ncbi:MAG: hypothetical protein ACOX0T_02225 [Pelotomaculum sp.]|jgi:hypothetical protein